MGERVVMSTAEAGRYAWPVELAIQILAAQGGETTVVQGLRQLQAHLKEPVAEPDIALETVGLARLVADLYLGLSLVLGDLERISVGQIRAEQFRQARARLEAAWQAYEEEPGIDGSCPRLQAVTEP